MANMEEMSSQVKKRRWKMIGHIMRKKPEEDLRIAMKWTPPGKRRRGRPSMTWRRMVEKERDQRWRSWAEVAVTAADRSGWRAEVSALCATRHEEDR